MFLVTDYYSQVLSNLIAVFLMLAAKSIHTITKRIILYFWPQADNHSLVREVAEKSHFAEGFSARSISTLVAQIAPGFHEVGENIQNFNFGPWLRREYSADVGAALKHAAAESWDSHWTLGIGF